MCHRTALLAAALALSAAVCAGEEKAAPKKLDWTDPATLTAYWKWAAAKTTLPASIGKTSFDVAPSDGKFDAVAMLETAAPALDDLKKATLQAANIIGQMLVQGAPIGKVGIAVKSGEDTGIVMLPVENLRKLGAESAKGANTDWAAVKKMADTILKGANWDEVDKLVKKRAGATPPPAK
ncbi:MAG: hypothetical protein NTW87_09405 [Planctomycetota bacterium]|nr:hypothetical protein [Planctomycetota bacterium]